MASRKCIKLTQQTKPDIGNMYDYVVLKYSFEVDDTALERSMKADLAFMNLLEAQTDELEDQIADAMQFLSKRITNTNHIGVKYNA